MKWKKQVLTILYLITISFLAYPQPNTDSLKSLLKTTSMEERIDIYNQILNTLARSEPQEAIILCNDLLSYADSISNVSGKSSGLKWLGLSYEKLARFDEARNVWEEKIEIDKELKRSKDVAYATMALANCLYHMTRYDESLDNFEKASKILTEIDDIRGMGMNYGNMALVYEKLGLFTQAINCKYDALKSAEQLADTANIAHSWSAIANSYVKMEDYQKAIENYNKAIGLYERIGNTLYVVHTISNLGVAYNSLDENEKAMAVFRKGLAVSESSHDNYGKAIVQMNMGEILLEMNQPDSAIYFLTASNNFFSDQNLQHPLCYNYKVMGTWYKEEGDTQKAIEFLTKAYEMSSEIEALEIHRDAAHWLSEVYESMGEFEKALKYQKTFKHYSDSLFNKDNVAEATRLESQYQFEKEQAKTEILHQAKLSKKQTIIISVSSGLAVVLALLVLLIIEYRRKNAAFKALYRKNMEMLENSLSRKKNDILKNGDLFIEIERSMLEEKLFRQKDLSRDTIAEQLGSNREYVHQAIKDHAQKTVSDYISNWRIDEAMKILSDPERCKGKTMLDISDEIGLSATSPSTFYTLFNKFSGMTPAQFRKLSQTKK